MRVPTIHRNGTGKGDILKALEEATSVLHRAEAAVAATAPNARDYYPQGTGAFEEARKEHESRASRIHEVREELCEIWEQIE